MIPQNHSQNMLSLSPISFLMCGLKVAGILCSALSLRFSLFNCIKGSGSKPKLTAIDAPRLAASPTFLLSPAPIEMNARGGDPNCFWLQAMYRNLLLRSLARFASPTFLLSSAPIEMNARGGDPICFLQAMHRNLLLCSSARFARLLFYCLWLPLK